MRTNQLAKLFTDTFQNTKPVVLCQSSQESLDNGRGSATSVLLQLGDNLRLVRVGETGRAEDAGEFGVVFEDAGEGRDCFCCWVESRGFCCCCVLDEMLVCWP